MSPVVTLPSRAKATIAQLFHPFRDGLDYAFILHRLCDAPDAGRVIQILRSGS
jgi:hypothetical protein